jgi:predicted molibdopterin-dependent oxidoreductase YjgC
LSHPLVRKNGRLERASWNEALEVTAKGFASVLHEHGGRAIGVLSSAKCSNEENFLLQKLARAVFATNNIDHCARL